jgi:LDH2 family malate/lactate/ureidoglycolate dehydrogenase
VTGEPPGRDDGPPVHEVALRAQAGEILEAWGFGPDAVTTAVDGLVWADLRGIASHGVAMLPIYEGWLRAGRFDVAARPTVVAEGPAIATVDGGSGMGFATAHAAMTLAIAKARRLGLAAVAARRSNHFGAAGRWATMASDAGLIGLVTSSTVSPAIVPTGGLAARFGTNPIAFAAPGECGAPFVLDMATSTVALGRLMVASLRGEHVPQGWALGPDGRPTTDPALGYRSRLATPLGALPELSSHKGSGLAAMVEILSVLLSGATLSMDDPGPGARGDVGHCFVVLDPRAFGGGEGFGAALDAMLGRLRATPAADPLRPVLAAGDPERAALARAREHGVVLPRALVEALRGVADRAKCPWVLGPDTGPV